MEGNKKYFAFISYKREDEDWAKWFQNELENYHLPSSLNGRSDLPQLPQSFRPVFRDIDELKAGNLPEQIYEALERSINLVVICSPLSAKSDWVNKEIADFIDIGKKKLEDNFKHIFPFIIDGIPHSGDDKTECLPKTLEKLPKDKDIVGGNVTEGGNVSEESRERAFVKVLAGMLPKEISFGMLWDKYERDKVKKEQKEREQKEKLQIIQSRFLAEKANYLTQIGDVDTATLLLLEALPQNVDVQERPLVTEAVDALKTIINYNVDILRCNYMPKEFSVSPDGNYISCLSDKNTIEVWSLKNNLPCFSINFGKKKEVHFCSFSTDSKSLFIGHTKGYVIWDIECGVRKGGFDDKGVSPKWRMRVGAYNHDNLYFISGLSYKKCSIRIWNCTKSCFLMDSPIYSASDLPITFSKDGKYFTTSNARNWIIIRNSDNGEIFRVLMGHQSNIRYASFNNDGQMLVSVGNDDTMRIWDIKREKELHCVNIKAATKLPAIARNSNYLDDGGLEYKFSENQHIGNGHPRKAIFNSTGENIFVAHNDGNIYIYEKNGQLLKTMYAHRGAITSIELSSDDKYLFSSSYDGTIKRWTIKEETAKPFIKILDDAQNAYYSSNGNYIVATKYNSKFVYIHDLTLQETYKLESDCRVIMAKFSDDDVFVVVLLDDCKIQIWNLEKRLLEKTIAYENNDKQKYLTSKFKDINVSRDMNLICKLPGLDEDDLFTIEQTRKNRPSIVLKKGLISTKSFKWMAINPKKKQCLLDNNNIIRIFDFIEGKVIKTIMCRNKSITPTMYSPDGRFIISATNDNSLKVWDSVSGSEVKTLNGHHGLITYVEFSQDGKMVVSSSRDSTVRIWSFESGKELLRLSGHVYDMASFSSDGTKIVTVSSKDSILIVWDRINKKRLFKINGREISSAFFNSQGDKILVVSPKSLSILNCEAPELRSFQQLIDQTRERFKNRPLTPEERKKYYLD